MSVEPPAPPQPHRGGLEGFLSKKIGPVPVWLLIGVAGGAVLILLRGRASSPGTAPQAASGAVEAPGGPSDGGAGTGGGGLEQFPIVTPGPTGNTGGFEDPLPGGFADTPFDFGDPGISSSPPPSDPVVSPGGGGRVSPNRPLDLLQLKSPAAIARLVNEGKLPTQPVGKFAMSRIAFAPAGNKVENAGFRAGAVIEHPFSSPSGRIARDAAPFSMSQVGTVIHTSSAARDVAPEPLPMRPLAGRGRIRAA